jgi:hypothetical protein
MAEITPSIDLSDRSVSYYRFVQNLFIGQDKPIKKRGTNENTYQRHAK